MCLACASGYEKELRKLVAERFEKSTSNSIPLPKWLRAAKADASDQSQSKEPETQWSQRTEELLERWRETCSRLHPNANLAAPPPARALCQAPRLRTLSQAPVATDLALGQSVQQNQSIRVVDPGGCTLDLLSRQEKLGCGKGDDVFKRLYKGLMEEVAWQADAAAAVASTVAACRSGGSGKQQLGGTRNDTWLLLRGPDKVGKRRMAAALSELVFGAGGDRMVSVSLAGGEDGYPDSRYWGKVAVDRIADAVRRNPFAVFVLEDVDRAELTVQESLRRAAERGRIPDSHGRDVSLGSSIFVLTSRSTPEDVEILVEESDEEKRLEAASRFRYQLELLVEGNPTKRRPEWLMEEERQTKRKKDPNGGLSLDLNLTVGRSEDEAGDNSRNLSDVTVELQCAHDHGRLSITLQTCSLLHELASAMDGTVAFKPVDFAPLRGKLVDAVREKFESILGREHAMEVEDEAIDGIVGRVWFGGAVAAAREFEEWTERVVVQSFWQLKNRGLVSDGTSVVKLVAVKDGYTAAEVGGGLPERIAIVSRC